MKRGHVQMLTNNFKRSGCQVRFVASMVSYKRRCKNRTGTERETFCSSRTYRDRPARRDRISSSLDERTNVFIRERLRYDMLMPGLRSSHVTLTRVSIVAWKNIPPQRPVSIYPPARIASSDRKEILLLAFNYHGSDFVSFSPTKS